MQTGKRRTNKGIRPKTTTDSVGLSYYRDLNYKLRYIECPAGRANKDNSRWGKNMKGCPSGNVVRWPSIKRPDKVWRNFYRLFPRLYFHVRASGAKPGTIVSLCVPGSTTKLDGSAFPNVTRTIKVKVLDMTGEFNEIENPTDTIYYRPKTTILNRNKRKQITDEII